MVYLVTTKDFPYVFSTNLMHVNMYAGLDSMF